MRFKELSFDIVVAGGGLAGLCAAVSAARHGRKVCLIHDRPVLGGVASSEMRVTVHGSACHHDYARETGIIGEILTEERSRNHETINENGWTNSVMDMVLYDLATKTKGLTLYLNTSVYDLKYQNGTLASEVLQTRPEASLEFGFRFRKACPADSRIHSLFARIGNAETTLELQAKDFVDCTGDGLVADLAGCEWRWGTEGIEEFKETHAPAKASTDTMGNSIHIRCRDMDQPCPFTPPDWAVKHEDPDYFYKAGRVPHDPRGGFWWIEIGIPWDTIHDNETIRHELTRHALGVWDWMKNRDPKMMDACKNYALDFIGQWPGKRESRRIAGQYLMTEHDVQDDVTFDDEVAFGGWFVDLHTPGGLLAGTSEPHAAEGYKADSEYLAKSHVGPYGIPLRILIAKDIQNLMMAGRNVSVTHATLGTVRVMGTTSIMGQAVGTALAVAQENGVAPAQLDKLQIQEIQQRLHDDGCFLPNVVKQNPGNDGTQASIFSSSVATATGLRVDENWESGGHFYESGAKEDETVILDRVLGQIIPCDGSSPGRLTLKLRNSASEAVKCPIRLVQVKSIWDYRIEETEILAKGEVEVFPNGSHIVIWDPGPLSPKQGWLRVELGPSKGLSWHTSHALPGPSVSFTQISPKRFKHGRTRLAVQWENPQKVFDAKNVLSGDHRPNRSIECWRSDASQAFPQTLTLNWNTPKTIREIQITFAGNLWREVHGSPPFYHDPQTIRNYALIIEENDGEEKEIITVKDNIQRRVRHQIENTVSAKSLKLRIDSTWGDPSACVYEIRVK